MTDFNDFPLVEKPYIAHLDHLGGVQLIYKFDNDYGASVINTPFSAGNAPTIIEHVEEVTKATFWELAVIQFYGDGERWELARDEYELIAGTLTREDIQKLLEEIKNYGNEEEQ